MASHNTASLLLVVKAMYMSHLYMGPEDGNPPKSNSYHVLDHVSFMQICQA